MAVDVDLGFAGPIALDTIFAFKNGVVPTTDLAEITVGRSESLLRCRTVLAAVSARTNVEVDFIEGAYGFGKSHLLEIVRTEALRQGFAVASIAANFDSVAMHRAPLVHRAIAASLELSDQPTVGLIPLLRNLVEQPAFIERTAHLYQRWQQSAYRSFDQSLSVWPSGIYAATVRPQLVEIIARWLSGEPTQIAQLRQLIGTVCSAPRRMSINAGTLPEIVAGLARSVRQLGYTGLVLLVDEAENALGPMSTPRQRQTGAMFLYSLSLWRAPMYVVVAATPSVALSLEPDLRRPVAPWLPTDPRDALRFVLGRLAPANRLPIAELSQTGLRQLATKITELHGQAFRWDAQQRVDRDVVLACVARAMERREPTRAFVKRIVEVLELCEQHPSVRPKTLVQA